MFLKNINLFRSSSKFGYYINQSTDFCREQDFKIVSKPGEKTKTLKNTTDIDKIVKLQVDDLEKVISYKLYTRQLTEPILLTYENWNMTKENFKFDKEVKLITHGWLSSGKSTFAESVKDAYLVKEDLNVIIVDWSPLASNILYPITMIHTKSIGKHFAKFLNYLVDNGLNLDNVHLVGHSLGAHISGFCGREIITGKANRLTALDPALPGFPQKLTPTDHISHTDARFVDVIHTCGGSLGILFPVGHADFYPNSGISPQPGCSPLPKGVYRCSHSRSWMYFVESINRNHKFVAKKYKSWYHYINNLIEEEQDVLMGDPCPLVARGIYYLKTNSKFPFALEIKM